MKKYLMTAVAALALCAGFTACSSDDEGSYSLNRQEVYKQAFEKEFGKVAANQNWGFVNQTGVNATRSHNVNRNEWGTGNGVGGHVAVPVNVTDKERQLVLAEFSKQRVGAQNEYNVVWTDFYVTQVWKGTTQYYDESQYEVVNGEKVLKADAQPFTGSDKMNHLQAKFSDADVALGDGTAWEHINDFNNGDFKEESTQYHSDDIIGHTFMENSGTYDFAYHNSVDSKYHNEYIIIPGEKIDPSLAGYYYVGFDFYATHPEGQDANKNMDVERDWIFNDWIVRISPGEFVGSQRIFIEDLITSGDLSKIDPSDWDFNDAVFDAFINYDPYYTAGNYAVITLRAAGGTLPLYIAGHEVHQLFGVEQDVMVNTGKGVEKAPVQFRITGDAVKSANAKDIEVIVTSRSGENIRLTAEEGQPTQMLAAPIEEHVKWLKERVHIKNGYPSFMDYVGDPTVKWWKPAVEEYLYQKWYK